jgi:hypothetical protein
MLALPQAVSWVWLWRTLGSGVSSQVCGLLRGLGRCGEVEEAFLGAALCARLKPPWATLRVGKRVCVCV